MFSLNIWGRESLNVVDVRGGGWMVLDYENRSAKISTGTGTDRWFRRFDSLGDIAGDDGWNINTNNDNFMIMAETGNGFNYNKQMLGYQPRKAKVLRGFHAKIMGNQTMAPTLSRTTVIDELADTLIALFANVIPGIELYVAVLSQMDICVPNDGLHIDGGSAMGVITHEYGHYTTFSMLMDYGVNPIRMDTMLLSYLGERAGGVDEDEDTNIIAESLADVYAAQIVSGTNYFRFDNAQLGIPGRNGDHKMAFCRKNDCADHNFRAPTDRKEQQRLLVEMMHDALDDSQREINNAPKNVMLPSHADAWERLGTTKALTYAPNLNGSINDEDVAIGGRGFRTMMRYMAWEGVFRNPFTKAILKDCLTKVIQEHPFDDNPILFFSTAERSYMGSHSWCDACDLFVLHESTVPTAMTIDHVNGNRYERTRWQLCQSMGVISNRIGPAPDPDLRMDADCNICPDRHISVMSGNNVQCDPCLKANEVALGNTCHECNPFEHPVGNECIPCPAGEHYDILTGACKACPDGTGWNINTVTCDPCEVDMVLTIDETLTTCGDEVFMDMPLAGQKEICPQEFWIEVDNLQWYMNEPYIGDFAVLLAGAVSQGTNDAASCADSHVSKEIWFQNSSNDWIKSGSTHETDSFWDIEEHSTPSGFCADPTPNPGVRNNRIRNGLDKVRFRLRCEMDGDPADCIARLRFKSGCTLE